MQLFDEIAMKLRLHKNGDSFLFPTANFIKNFWFEIDDSRRPPVTE